MAFVDLLHHTVISNSYRQSKLVHTAFFFFYLLQYTVISDSYRESQLVHTALFDLLDYAVISNS